MKFRWSKTDSSFCGAERSNFHFFVLRAFTPTRGLSSRFHLMTFGTQYANEFARKVLVEENLHAGWRSGLWASSARTPRTDSSLKLAYASTISAILMPEARDSRIRDGNTGSTHSWTASKMIRVSDNPCFHTTQAYARCTPRLQEAHGGNDGRFGKNVRVSVVIWGSHLSPRFQRSPEVHEIEHATLRREIRTFPDSIVFCLRSSSLMALRG